MSTFTIDGVEIPIVGYGVMGFEDTGNVVIRQYDAHEEAYAHEYVECVNEHGGNVWMAPIVDIVTKELP